MDSVAKASLMAYIDFTKQLQDLRSILCWRGFKPRQRRAYVGADKKIA